MARRSILAASWILCAACATGGTEDARPHIILITSDALRPDHLSVHGYARATSPEIDDFAGQVWHFTDAVTVIPKTGPAFTTMFTGLHPQEHSVRSNFVAIPETLPVLAERLRGLGYRTAAFVSNPVLRPAKGYARGFDHYELFNGRRDEGVRSVNEAFLSWASGAWDGPSFVWIHYMDPHGPYDPPEELLRPFLDDELAASDERVPLEPATPPTGNPNKVLGSVPAYQRLGDEDRVAVYVARYDAEIRYMDAAFGELIRYLRERDLYDASAIVFSADHGESLGEHDFYFEHGWFAHEPSLRIPLMIKPPGEVEARTVDRQVSVLDFLPTLLGFAGAAVASGGSGVDLGGAGEPVEPVLVESSDLYPDKYHGVRTSGWKYLVREGDGAEELYDLREDPGEIRNVAGRETERLAELRGACEDALRRAREAAVPATTGPPDDPETLERLKALGYVD
jgi:arylsulfatase